MNVELGDKHFHWLTVPLCCLLLSVAVFRVKHQEADELKRRVPVMESLDKGMADMSIDFKGQKTSTHQGYHRNTFKRLKCS